MAEPSSTDIPQRNWLKYVSIISRVSFVTLCCTVFLLVVSATYHIVAKVPSVENRCRMTYMSPNYYQIPLLPTGVQIGTNSSSPERQEGATFEKLLLHPKLGRSRLAHKYRLFRYTNQVLGDNPLEPKGYPVIFVPGSMGSYGQVRAIAAQSTMMKKKNSKDGVPLDFYTLDFQENPSGISGYYLWQHAEFLNDCINTVLGLYTSSETTKKPRNVLVLAHSMGGVVARIAPMMPNYIHDSIRTILSLSTPHTRPVVQSDWHLQSVYSKMNGFWRKSLQEELWLLQDLERSVHRAINSAGSVSSTTAKGLENEDASEQDTENEDASEQDTKNEDASEQDTKNEDASEQDTKNEDAPQQDSENKDTTKEQNDIEHNSREHKVAHAKLRGIVLVSIAGGYRDFIVPSSAAAFLPHKDQVVSQTRGFSTLTSAVPGVKLSTDHLAILWCNQLVAKVSSVLQDLAHLHLRPDSPLGPVQEARVQSALAALSPNPDAAESSEAQFALEQARLTVAEHWEDVLRRRELLVGELLQEFPPSAHALAALQAGHTTREYVEYAPEFSPEAFVVDAVRQHYPLLLTWTSALGLLLLAETARQWHVRSFALDEPAPAQPGLLAMLYPWNLLREVREEAMALWATSQLFRHLATSAGLLLAGYLYRDALAQVPGGQQAAQALQTAATLLDEVGLTTPEWRVVGLLYVVATTAMGLLLMIALLLRSLSNAAGHLAARSNALITGGQVAVQAGGQLWRSVIAVSLLYYPLTEGSDWWVGRSPLSLLQHLWGALTGTLGMLFFVAAAAVLFRVVQLPLAPGLAPEVARYRVLVTLQYLPCLATLVPVALQVQDAVRPPRKVQELFHVQSFRESRRATIHPPFPQVMSQWNETTKQQFYEVMSSSSVATRHQMEAWEVVLPLGCIVGLLVVALHLHRIAKRYVTLQPKVMDLVWGPIEIVEQETEPVESEGSPEEISKDISESDPLTDSNVVEVTATNNLEVHGDTNYDGPSKVVRISGELLQIDTLQEDHTPKHVNEDAVPLIVSLEEEEIGKRRSRQRTLTRRIRAGTSVVPVVPQYRWCLRLLAFLSVTVVGDSAPRLMLLTLMYAMITLGFDGDLVMPEEKVITTIEPV